MSDPASIDSIFLLGAGGFIGRHLAGRFAQAGIPVIAATRQPTAFDHPGIRNVVAPWDDREQFAQWLPQCRAIVHAASSSTPGSSAAKPQLDGNLRTTLAMIEALQDTPACRLLFLSSAGTLYGDREAPAREDDPLRPRSYHGAGKAAAEHFVHAWATQYGGTAVLLRPSNVYGPGQPARRGFGIIPAAFDCALHGTPLTIFDGSTVRDYLYIDDFMALCDATLDAPLDGGAHVFNAAYGEGVSLDTLIDRIDAVTGRAIERRYQAARRVDIHTITADTTAARSTFPWSPAITLDEGLRRTWQWFSTQA
ncbi:NAD-dependent epimerase/dehydratase family protein [Lysobacter sp. A6]|uniref:NAD-dependent epimerase/dehydratase family protein n=1 Tax=Noviluteimonas lactosilytica TaxID=2888523 RepID=A0ABS8JFV5_9GAMM|nr:NAD-dependent epimerase/dehydratase family protein [Lysobacter lactosilyticus]MCC8362495.1 NAD-dependent epimerase/dehydratase family protein [Lysobacter lactosilyticus]